MVNRIMLNQTSYHGCGAIQEIASEAKAHGFQKAFVLRPGSDQVPGTAKSPTDILDQKWSFPIRFIPIWGPTPPLKNVQHGVNAFKECGADYIIIERRFLHGRQGHRHHCGHLGI